MTNESDMSTGATDRTECTDKSCKGDAKYALWMGDQFSRVIDAHETMSYDDGDLHPHVCESCLPRYEDLHGDKGEFVRPVEKLAADGGTRSQQGYGWICTGCKKVVSSQPFGPCHDCGSHYRPASADDLACDRCGSDDGKRLLDRSGEFDRLCEGCIQDLGLRNDQPVDTETDRSDESV